MTPRRTYPTDLSDARWALIEPVLSAWRAERAQAGLGLSEPVHDLREIVNAILYVNRTGIAWEYLPHDLPPCKTVYDYYAKWEKDGTTLQVHDLLRGQVREQAGRAAEPTAAIIDAQVIKASSNVAEGSQGYDAGKKTKGRKRHIATDTLGLLLALVITTAAVQDTNGGKLVTEQLAGKHPTVTAGWVDGGYKAGFLEHAAEHGITFAVGWLDDVGVGVRHRVTLAQGGACLLGHGRSSHFESIYSLTLGSRRGARNLPVNRRTASSGLTHSGLGAATAADSAHSQRPGFVNLAAHGHPGTRARSPGSPVSAREPKRRSAGPAPGPGRRAPRSRVSAWDF
jgi:transposase